MRRLSKNKCYHTQDAHLLPRIDDFLDTLCDSKYFNTLDFASGYWQVEDRETTAFVTHSGLYKCNVNPFGLVNALATFQRLMTIVFSGKILSCIHRQYNNILENFTRPQLKTTCCFKTTSRFKTQSETRKEKFAYTSVLFLWHVVNNKGISPDPSKTDKILKWPTPKSMNKVRSFLGVNNYYRRFIKKYLTFATPLNRLL